MRNSSSELQVELALEAVRSALRQEIANRIAAGEFVASAQGDEIIATHPATRDLAARRRELIANQEREQMARETVEHKSVA